MKLGYTTRPLGMQMCSPTQRLPKSHLLGFLWRLPPASMVKYLLHFQPLFPLWRIRGGAKSGLVFLVTRSPPRSPPRLTSLKQNPPLPYCTQEIPRNIGTLFQEPSQRSIYIYIFIISVWHLHCAYLCKTTFINIGTSWLP